MHSELVSYREISKLCEHLDSEAVLGFVTSARLQAMVRITFSAALRSAEIRNLSVNDVRINSNDSIHITVRDSRVVSIPAFKKDGNHSETLIALLNWLKVRNAFLNDSGVKSDYLFCTRKGNQMDSKNFSNDVKKAGRRAGIHKEVTPLLIRRTRCASILNKYGETETMKYCGFKSKQSVRKLYDLL